MCSLGMVSLPSREASLRNLFQWPISSSGGLGRYIGSHENLSFLLDLDKVSENRKPGSISCPPSQSLLSQPPTFRKAHPRLGLDLLKCVERTTTSDFARRSPPHPFALVPAFSQTPRTPFSPPNPRPRSRLLFDPSPLILKL